MTVYKESALADSTLFQTLNKTGEITRIIQECIKTGEIITKDYIEEQLMQIQRTRISPLADSVIDAYEHGDIIIIYAKVLKVPQALPFTIARVAGKPKAFVFVNNYGTVSDKGKVGGGTYLNMPMKDLYVLMEGAYTALKYYANPIQITKNLGLMKTTANIYASMYMRIFNREYALSMDQDLYNRVYYCIARFYLDNVWESRNGDLNSSYAMSGLLNANRNDLMIVSDAYEQAGIKDVDAFMDFLKTLSPRLEKLNMRYFTQCYINMFKPAAIFSMECLPYMLFAIETALIGSFLVNQPMLTDIMKNVKGSNTIYAELSKVL